MDASNLYKDMGGLIRRQRRALDLTQAKLAARLGISRGALANIETGRQNIFVHQLYRLAAALELNVHDLLPVPTDVSIQDLLPRTAKEAGRTQSIDLPMPEGLTEEQENQVSRLITTAFGKTSKGE